MNFAGRRNSRREFWIANAIEKKHRNPNDPNDIPFDEITTLGEVEEFIKDTVYGFIEEIKEMEQTLKDQLVGNSFIVRILKTKERRGVNSYYSNYKDHKHTNGNTEEWKYKSATENRIKGDLVGYFSKYDGSGFTREADLFSNDVGKIIGDINEYISTNGRQIRAVIVTYSFYNKVMDLIISVNIVL